MAGVTLVLDKRREGSMPSSAISIMSSIAIGRSRGGHCCRRRIHGLWRRTERVLDQSDPEVVDFEQVRLVHDLSGIFLRIY